MPAPGPATESSKTDMSSIATTRTSAIRSRTIRLLAPVLPRKFLAIGLNYADHIAESGMEAPEYPVFFNKQITCVVGPDDDVHMPRVSNLLDYEGELAVVIGDSLPTRAGRARARGDRRLHDRQRRLGPRLADTHADDDDGQVVRHPRTARPLAGHRRRARRPTRPPAPHLRQRRAAPGRQHRRDDLQLLPAGRAPLLGVHARARRRHRHRHAGRHRRRAPAIPRGSAEGRRRRPVQIDGIGELRNTVVEEPEGYLAPETEVEVAWAR